MIPMKVEMGGQLAELMRVCPAAKSDVSGDMNFLTQLS